MYRHSEHATPVGKSYRAIFLLALFATAGSSGCTSIDLGNKAEAYNTAIAESNNEAILLNAVRASQRAPMSFVALGDVLAQPSVSGGSNGTVNLTPFGLTTYSITPNVSVNGGYSSFKMANLNQDEFNKKIRKSVDTGLIEYFVKLHWPEELLAMMFVADYRVSRQGLDFINRRTEMVCRSRADPRSGEICDVLESGGQTLAEAGCYQYPTGGTITILNTAREQCGMLKFQQFLRKVRLLNLPYFRNPYYSTTSRSAQGMLYYLGELIAAQNYSTKSYMPMTLVGTPIGRRLVPLFEVRRGVAIPGSAAVRVFYKGDEFYIPRPNLGSYDEARSMQVLDFVSQVIVAQTAAGDIPKVNTIGLIQTQ